MPKITEKYSVVTASSSSAPSPSGRRQSARRFPGPAGLLPFLKPTEFSCLDSPKSTNPLSKKINDIISSHQSPVPMSATQANAHVFCSQDEKSVFEQQTWTELLYRLKLNPDHTDSETRLDLMNINWLRGIARKLPGCKKIPFLVAVVHEAPELTNGKLGKFKAPCFTLVDPTGEFVCTKYFMLVLFAALSITVLEFSLLKYLDSMY